MLDYNGSHGAHSVKGAYAQKKRLDVINDLIATIEALPGIKLAKEAILGDLYRERTEIELSLAAARGDGGGILGAKPIREHSRPKGRRAG